MRLPLGAAVAALLSAAACSSGSAPQANAQGVRAEAAPGTAPGNAVAAGPPPAEPSARAAVATAAAGVRRCGWLSNPTPANWWLTDREGQWILGTQGADQASGMEDMPDMSTVGWVETNGHYGYGCACMTITAGGDGRVTLIADAEPRPLRQCRADRNLPKPE